MSLLKAENIFDVVRPLHMFSTLFGLTVFGVVKKEGKGIEKEWKAKVSIWSFLYILIISIADVIFLGLYFIHADHFLRFKGLQISEVIELIAKLTTIIFFSSMFAITWISFLTRKSIVKCINILWRVNKELSSIGINSKHQKHKNFILKFLIIFEFFLLVTATFTMSTTKIITIMTEIDTYMYTYIFFCAHLQHLFYFQFMLIMWSIKARYHKVNRFLYESFSIICCNDNAKFKNLNKAAKLHDMLVNASECVNMSFSISVRMKFFTFL